MKVSQKNSKLLKISWYRHRRWTTWSTLGQRQMWSDRTCGRVCTLCVCATAQRTILKSINLEYTESEPECIALRCGLLGWGMGPGWLLVSVSSSRSCLTKSRCSTVWVFFSSVPRVAWLFQSHNKPSLSFSLELSLPFCYDDEPCSPNELIFLSSRNSLLRSKKLMAIET